MNLKTHTKTTARLEVLRLQQVPLKRNEGWSHGGDKAVMSWFSICCQTKTNSILSWNCQGDG